MDLNNTLALLVVIGLSTYCVWDIRRAMKEPMPVDFKYRVTLNGYQIVQLAEFMGLDLQPTTDPDLLATEVAVASAPAHVGSGGERRPAGLYAWLADNPQEGSVFLHPDPENDEEGTSGFAVPG